jgi:hypothetical protein
MIALSLKYIKKPISKAMNYNYIKMIITIFTIKLKTIMTNMHELKYE